MALGLLETSITSRWMATVFQNLNIMTMNEKNHHALQMMEACETFREVVWKQRKKLCLVIQYEQSGQRSRSGTQSRSGTVVPNQYENLDFCSRGIYLR